MIISIFLKVRSQKKIVASQPQSINVDPSAGRKRRIHKQMFILMLSSICIFFITALPLVIYDTVAPYLALNSQLCGEFHFFSSYQ
jgi:hypothetical protein